MAPVGRQHPEMMGLLIYRMKYVFESETIIWYCQPPGQHTWVQESRGGRGMTPLTIIPNNPPTEFLPLILKN